MVVLSSMEFGLVVRGIHVNDLDCVSDLFSDLFEFVVGVELEFIEIVLALDSTSLIEQGSWRDAAWVKICIGVGLFNSRIK